MAIVPCDIKSSELVKVLVEEDDECIAKVLSNEGEYILVTYLYQTDKVYKTAGIYSFDSQAQRVDFSSLIEHYIGIIDVLEFDMKQVGKNMFVYKHEIDEESDSEIETDESSDDESESGSFIVNDDEESALLPDDHHVVDEEWKKWRPISAGARRFKEKIEQIEAHVKSYIDEKFVFKK